MAEYDFIKMQKKLAKYLDEDRYEHTLGVMFTWVDANSNVNVKP